MIWFFCVGEKGKISRNGAAGAVCHASILGKLSGGTNKHALSVSNILSSWIFRVARLPFSPGGLPNWFSWLDSSFRSYFFNPRAAKTWMHFFSYNHFIARATGGVPLGNVFIISTIDPGLTFSSCARQKSFLSDRTALPLTPCGSRHSEQQSTLLFLTAAKIVFFFPPFHPVSFQWLLHFPPFPLFLLFLFRVFNRALCFYCFFWGFFKLKDASHSPSFSFIFVCSRPARPRSGCTSCLSSQRWTSCTSCPSTLEAQRASQTTTGAGGHLTSALGPGALGGSMSDYWS